MVFFIERDSIGHVIAYIDSVQLLLHSIHAYRIVHILLPLSFSFET